MMVASPWVRQCVGTAFDVAAEEAGVVDPGLPGQRLDPGSGGQRGPRLVERDVPVGADPEDLQVDAARFADRVLVRRAGGRDVGGQAVGALDGAGSEVDPGHEHLVDDGPIPLGVVGGQADVLVEGESAGLPERDQPGVAARRQFVVDRQRRRSGRKAEDGVRFAVEQRADRVGGDAADLLGVRQDDDFHLLVRGEKACTGSDLRTRGHRFRRNDVARFAFVHDHNGDNGIESLGLDRRDVVGDDELARGDVVALADVGREALALQLDGVQTEVDQNADVVAGS